MAVWLDLSQRLEAELYQDERFEVGAIYRNSPLPGWLSEPWRQTQEDAQGKAPVLVINSRGIHLDDTFCLLRLADLERFTDSAAVRAEELDAAPKGGNPLGAAGEAGHGEEWQEMT